MREKRDIEGLSSGLELESLCRNKKEAIIGGKINIQIIHWGVWGGDGFYGFVGGEGYQKAFKNTSVYKSLMRKR